MQHDPLLIQGTAQDLGHSTLVFNSPAWDYILVPLTQDQQYELRITKQLKFDLLCLEHYIVTPIEVYIQDKEYA